MPLHFSWDQILTCFAVLFAVIDILGNIPVIVDLRSKVGHIQSEKATMVATALLISFLFFGENLLKIVGIDVESFAVAGSIVLFIIAIEMILNRDIHRHGESKTAASIVPIAFPLIAGAGSLTTTLSLKADYRVENIIVAILLNMIIVYLVLKYAQKLEKILGEGILNVLKKVFGIILMAIAIKLFTQNLGVLIDNL